MARKAKPKKPTRGEVKDYDGSTPLKDANQELFCVLYTSNSTPRFFGHGEHCYTFAYGFQEKLDKTVSLKLIKNIKNVCRSAGARLLLKVNIRARCNFLMDSLFTDEMMDRELVYVIQQRHDLQSKVRAWEQAAKLKQRIQDKVLHKIEFEPIDGITFVLPEKKTAKAK